MKVRLILEIEDRKARAIWGDDWETIRTEMRSAACSVLCDACNGDSGDVELIIDGPA